MFTVLGRGAPKIIVSVFCGLAITCRPAILRVAEQGLFSTRSIFQVQRVSSTHEVIFSADSEAQTHALAVALADALPPGINVSLVGTLGAGKTHLVRQIAIELGVEAERIVSPTFTLCQNYAAKKSICHLDAYRLKDQDEFLDLGPEEFFDSPSITFVEWGDRVADCFPSEYLEISIDVTGESSRRFRFTPHGEAMATFVQALNDHLPNVEFHGE